MTSSIPNLKLSNGSEIPILGLGTWRSHPGEVTEALKIAFELGYRHIDAAALYGNEKEIGIAIMYACETLKIPRSELFITSKLWNTKHRSEDVEIALRRTLTDLNLEYLDLYLMHWPMAFASGNEILPTNSDGSIQYDEDINPTDTWFEMEKLVAKGLVASIGVSNFNSVQLQDILDKGSIRPVINQIEVHPYLCQNKLINYCHDRGVAITAYSPLASPDRPWAQPNDPKLLDEPKLKAIGVKYNKSVAQILIRWAIERQLIVIPKSSSSIRIAENYNVFDFHLEEEDMETISSFDCNGRIIEPSLNRKPITSNHKHYPFNIEF